MTDKLHLVLERFRAAAANFIEAVDSMDAIEREAFLSRLSHSLAELYGRALDLPIAGPATTGVDEAAFQKLAAGAKQNCPLSKALAGVSEINLTAVLRK